VFALEEALMDAGYDVRSAHCAEDGLALFQDQPADIVLTDMKMPGMSGIELLGHVKKLEPHTQVIIITAYGTFDSAVEAVRLGAFDYIQKPFKINAVLQIIKKAIAEKNDKPAEQSVPETACESIPSVHKPLNIKERILPCGESLLGSLSLDVKTVPKEGLGADFYDYFHINEHKVLVVIGDVGENGLDGSLVMIMVKSLIRSEASHCDNPALILKRVNKLIQDQGIMGVPITLFLGVIDIRQGRLEYVNAGHEYPLFFRNNKQGSAEKLDGSATFIGLFDDTDFDVSSVSCSEGDLILFFTDGFIRVMEKKFNGRDPYALLEQLVCGSIPEKRYSLAEHLYHTCFDQNNVLDDDLTIMSLCMGNDLSHEKEIKCPCSNGSLVLLRSAAEDFLRALHLPYSERHAVVTALYEALINALSFAYPQAQGGELSVKYALDNNMLRIAVEDFGVGFDMSHYQPPDNESYEGLIKENGRGIFLMRNLMDNVEIHTHPGGGTRVVMEKRLAGAGI
jgi:sigma-B regulation protein RsbU (phosphoserine phosphatase)